MGKTYKDNRDKWKHQIRKKDKKKNFHPSHREDDDNEKNNNNYSSFETSQDYNPPGGN